MWQAALDAFQAAIADEGYTSWMYLDTIGLVTVGRGDLIDPEPQALALEWQRPDGSIATGQEVSAAWNQVKSHQELRFSGGASHCFSQLTSIRLSRNTIQNLVNRTISSMCSVLLTRCPSLESWPADAQLALLRWAWANGPSARYSRMFGYLAVGDFCKAATEAEWTNENPSTRLTIMTHFQRAAAVVANRDDVSQLLSSS